MNEQHATQAMMQHMLHRVNEFFHENKADFKSDEELGRAFSQFLRHKEKPPQETISTADARYAFHAPEDCVDENGVTVAYLRMGKDGHVGMMWGPVLFLKGAPMPDELREMLVRILRFHADRLEDRSLDARMRELSPDMTGTA